MFTKCAQNPLETGSETWQHVRNSVQKWLEMLIIAKKGTGFESIRVHVLVERFDPLQTGAPTQFSRALFAWDASMSVGAVVRA